jgi:hypothetical protein
MRRTRRLTAPLLLAALALDGCATVGYPTATPARGQDAITAERDAHECRARAATEVDSPLASGLELKVGWAIGGAVVGAGIGLGIASGNGDSAYGSSHPEVALAVIAAGAALGFVIGSIAGTFGGAKQAVRLSRAREDVFARCMTGRGYELR